MGLLNMRPELPGGSLAKCGVLVPVHQPLKHEHLHRRAAPSFAAQAREQLASAGDGERISVEADESIKFVVARRQTASPERSPSDRHRSKPGEHPETFRRTEPSGINRAYGPLRCEKPDKYVLRRVIRIFRGESPPPK